MGCEKGDITNTEIRDAPLLLARRLSALRVGVDHVVGKTRVGLAGALRQRVGVDEEIAGLQGCEEGLRNEGDIADKAASGGSP